MRCSISPQPVGLVRDHVSHQPQAADEIMLCHSRVCLAGLNFATTVCHKQRLRSRGSHRHMPSCHDGNTSSSLPFCAAAPLADDGQHGVSASLQVSLWESLGLVRPRLRFRLALLKRGMADCWRHCYALLAAGLTLFSQAFFSASCASFLAFVGSATSAS